jgi:glycosyltransferase involved in cell wall biosynthesis
MDLSSRKILMVSYTSFLQKFYQTLPKEIARLSGARVKVLVPPHWKELWSGGKIFLENGGEELIDISVGNVLRLLKTFKPDIIDLEDEPFNAGSFQIVLCRNWLSNNSKIVLHASQHQYRRYPPPFNLMEKYVLGRADAILVRNSMARDVLLKKGYDGELEIVTHGVDTSAFKIRKLPEKKQEISPNGKLIIGYVGALVEHKGVHHLIKASQGLECKILIIGDGDEKANLQKLAKQLKVDAQFVPNMSHSSVADYLSCMDMFVLPSLTKTNWVEKFGRVLIEAMASGVPVIGSNSGEIPTVLSKAGLIFQEADETDLREKISVLLQDHQLRKQLSIAGRERVLQNYSWEVIAKKTIEVYHRLLSK